MLNQFGEKRAIARSRDFGWRSSWASEGIPCGPDGGIENLRRHSSPIAGGSNKSCCRALDRVEQSSFRSNIQIAKLSGPPSGALTVCYRFSNGEQRRFQVLDAASRPNCKCPRRK